MSSTISHPHLNPSPAPTTLRRLSIPFFSRSSSSFLSLPLSRGSNSNDSSASTDIDTDFDAERESIDSTSPPLPITPTTPRTIGLSTSNVNVNFQSQSHLKSLGRERPELKKMPSLSTLTIRSWSRSSRTSVDSDSNMRKKLSVFRSDTNTNHKDDPVTESKSDRKSYSISKSDRTVVPPKPNWKESKSQRRMAKNDHPRSSLSLTLSRGSISSFFRSRSSFTGTTTTTGTGTDTDTAHSHLDKMHVHVHVQVDVEHAVAVVDDEDLSTKSSIGPPVQSRLVSPININDTNTNTDANNDNNIDNEYDYERARRGSDWPPSSARPMNIDLKGVSTFADEISSDACYTVISNTHNHSTRADTPLTMPTLRSKLKLVGGSTFLPPMLESPALNEDIFEGMRDIMDDKTEKMPDAQPATENTSTIDPLVSTESRLKDPIARSEEADTHKLETMDANARCEGESPQFDISIFSPRPNAPPAPVLRGLKLDPDTEVPPISPLELPTLQCRSQKEGHPIPTPNIPRDTPCQPTTSPSRTEMNWMDISTALGCLSSSSSAPKITTSPSVSTSAHHHQRDGLQRVNRVRIPSASRTHPRTTRSISISSHTPFTVPIGDRVPTRRSSLIIRPSVLPCHTPPSLITSPKSLGNANIPPLFSPSTIVPLPQPASTSASSFQLGNGNGNIGPGLSLSRRNRGSLRLHLTAGNGSTFSRVGTDIGSPSSAFFASPTAFPPFASAINTVVSSQSKVEEPIEHVPTPGTFGLGGEADRQVVGAGAAVSHVGVYTSFNPYFAI